MPLQAVLGKVLEQFQPGHVETYQKHVGDLASIGAILSFWISLVAHWAQPMQIIVGCLATIASFAWLLPRAISQWLSLADQIKERRARKNKESN